MTNKEVDWNHINENLIANEQKYLEFESMRVFCGTFNVNGKLPDESLSSWISSVRPVDIYAIGIQEVVDLTTSSFLLQTDWAEKEQLWTQTISNEINDANKNFKFKLLTRIRMFGLYLLIFINETFETESNLTDVLTSSVATGILTVGNKGSLGVSMKLYETRICFVCSHFAAEVDKLEKRNADFRTTTQYLRFENGDSAFRNFFDLDQHDIIFWFGDLNYRVDSITLSNCLKLIKVNAYDELIKYDQLNNQKEMQRVFENYKEGEIRFRPTYKYLIKSDIYEKQALAESNDNNLDSNNNNAIVGKLKLPSWTDRVLWKSFNLKVDLVEYNCINSITLSDHKPVFACFQAQLKRINKQKYNNLLQDLLKESDRRHNDEIPHIVMEHHDFKFGQCMFYDRKNLYMIIKNDSRTSCMVNAMFYDSSNCSGFNSLEVHSNKWVSMSPQHIERVEPDTSFTIELVTNFNQSILSRLNREKVLEDFLVIRCLNGNDAFATISCIYQPSIMGVSLKALSTIEISFEKCDQKNLIESVEESISQYETSLDDLLVLNLKKVEIKLKKENISMSQKELRLETYKQTFELLKKDMLDKKESMFSNCLSSEYAFLLEHLIARCKKNLMSFDVTRVKEPANSTIEDQKNLILSYLSNKEFSALENEQFDLELLGEVLVDLVSSLPHSLIPERFFDYCFYLVEDSYDKASELLSYIPVSHCKLFELIVKFLQVYLKCLASCDSNIHNILSEAIFKPRNAENIKKNNREKQAEMASKFLKLFIENM